MKEYGVIFSGPMVRAVLEGRKTQTRRVVKIRVSADEIIWNPKNMVVRYPVGDFFMAPQIEAYRIYPCWHVGDRLWMKETWCPLERCDWKTGTGREENVNYKADSTPAGESDRREMGYSWRSPRFMPRWASRFTGDVLRTWIEPLQDISEEDAKAEGVEFLFSSTTGIAGIDGTTPESHGYKNYLWHGNYDVPRSLIDTWPHQFSGYKSARDSFSSLWQSLNGKKPGCSCADNPWILGTEFRRVE